MAGQGYLKKGVVKLPQSNGAFFAELKTHGCSAEFAAGSLNRKSKIPLELQQMIHYSYPGLTHGRPLNKVMIVLVGQTGAGKSTTINTLFNDSICQCSSSSSETRTVTEYGKELCVKDPGSPSVVGTLSFVDPPGALDVDMSKEASNLAIITKFRDQCPDLRPRKKVLRVSSFIRERVYPNLVLMAIQGASNRMDGADSNLRKCLRALEKYRLTDRLYPNLIVVVTHAMMIPTKSYRKETTLMTHIIQEAVFEILHLTKVQVVYVENNPENYNLTKPQGFDFYQLPDGRLSHYNLITAIAKQFDKNGDVLGKLFCGWYFSDDCPEKQDVAAVLDSIEETKLSVEETEEALQMLASIDMQLSADDDIVPPRFDFQLLGRGYCPKSESPKNITVYQEADTTKRKLLNTLYTVPKCFKFLDDGEDHILPISFATKSAYENKRSSLYGLEKDVKLVARVDSKARWVKDASNSKASVTRCVYEKRLLVAKLADPEINVKKEVMEEIENLPASYSQYNVECFQDFFNTHGSHFVHQVWIGGYVLFNSSVKTTTYNEKIGLAKYRKLRDILTKLLIPGAEGNEYSGPLEGSNDKDIQSYSLVIEGGDPPQVTTLAELTVVRHLDWIETLKQYPVELPYSLKLHPYYSLVKNARRRTAFTQATLQYLEDTIPIPTRPLSPTKRHAMFFEEAGPSAMLVDAELKRYIKEEEEIQANQIKRNDIGTMMVQKAQATAKESNPQCIIL